MFELGDLTVRYPRHDAAGDGGARTAIGAEAAIGLEIFPTELADHLAPPRDRLPGDAARHHPDTGPARHIEPLAAVARAGDPVPEPFAGVRTLRRTATTAALRLRAQRATTTDTGTETTTDTGTEIVTELSDGQGLLVVHRLTHRPGDPFIRIRTRAANEGDRPFALDLISSFTLGGITPFAADDAPGRLVVHRIRSAWSAEARLVSATAEQLHLERPWVNIGTVAERFGAPGSMPAAGWMPWLAVEDTEAGVVWGVQLAAGGPWQLELLRSRDGLAIGGGPADHDFGHWRRTLSPGESYEAPEAVVTAVHGDLDALCARLTRAWAGHPRPGPERTSSLPAMFNEYATTWGNPTHDRILALADRLQSSGVRYFVIDCGWFSEPGEDWGRSHGDWTPSAERFPHGLAETARQLRERGFVPGLWWEPETTGELSRAYKDASRHIAYDGVPVHVSARRFLDLRRPEVAEPLLDRMTALLSEGGFGYLKIDYNAHLGPGDDGEGLRELTAASRGFIARLSARLPDLVIENCAGGGHRIDPAYAALTAVSSGSDAFEAREAPAIAAGLQRVLLPRQSLVWATVRADDSDAALVYKLAAGFLGRICLSGDPDRLDERQWALVREALDLYGRAAPLIDDGTTRQGGTRGAALRNAVGWQSVVRLSPDGRRALVVLHAFADPDESLSVTLPDEGVKAGVGSGADRGAAWTLDAWLLADGTGALSLAGDRLRWQRPPEWSGAVALLSR
ncbi:family 36 glycoside hydrolase [Streptomyces bingchenggensis BCW-1]|uniref:Family 36 glycoside hydrolase n=2 Tax=Streptomyces TaxID=1883 RepID=D7C7G4_STRBB|nr:MULTISPECIES: glycoside hydrolase family 36 protein [Streptomyces]ADI10518.1 family 36 glycoside hydrolase [Streptomyces bingchenggensis BCW-1]